MKRFRMDTNSFGCHPACLVTIVDDSEYKASSIPSWRSNATPHRFICLPTKRLPNTCWQISGVPHTIKAEAPIFLPSF